MLSLYIHIPFCASKCAYCSFNSFPVVGLIDWELQITNYVEALKKEIDHYAEVLKDKEVKTLYFWGWTPSRIESWRIIDIVEYIRMKFDLENLAELSIELNPYPEAEVLKFIQVVNKKYEQVSRVRYSFGIQSFDDEVLKVTWRAYSFSGVVEFLRSLVKFKKDNTVFNFDFIAFGKFQVSKNGYKQLWHEFKREFFQKFLESWYVDSVSLYTLEGLKDGLDEIGAKATKGQKDIKGKSFSPLAPFNPLLPPSRHGSDEDIMEEFTLLKDSILNAGFKRYEISNFAKASKASIHNMVYWNMENYLWLWLSASSFFNHQWLINNPATFQRFNTCLPVGKVSTFQHSWVRWTNTADLKQYIEWHRIDEKEVHVLNESDILIEEFFLRLRTHEGIADIGKFKNILIPNYQWLITNYQWAWLVSFDGKKLQLTDSGMNVSNSIITDLLLKI